jgi:hypothetical protein
LFIFLHLIDPDGDFSPHGTDFFTEGWNRSLNPDSDEVRFFVYQINYLIREAWLLDFEFWGFGTYGCGKWGHKKLSDWEACEENHRHHYHEHWKNSTTVEPAEVPNDVDVSEPGSLLLIAVSLRGLVFLARVTKNKVVASGRGGFQPAS